MDMAKKYDMTEQEGLGQMVRDDSVLEYAKANVTADALPPYTEEELFERIAMAEVQIEAGMERPSSAVFADLRRSIISRL